VNDEVNKIWEAKPYIQQLRDANKELKKELRAKHEKLERVSNIAMNVSILLDETKGKLTICKKAMRAELDGWGT